MTWMSRVSGRLPGVIAVAWMIAGQQGWAACDVDFDIAPAKGLSAAMVRKYEVCPSTARGSYYTQWTETDGGVDACTPVIPQEYDGDATPYRYGENGRCDVKLSSKLTSDCSTLEDGNGVSLGLPPGPCHVTKVKAKCSGIERPDGRPIDEADNFWTLNLLARASIDEPLNGSMTVVDLPMIFEFEPASNGSLKLSGTSAEAWRNYGVDLPPCSSLEIADMTIRDPQQNSFAAMGGATRP